MSKRGREMGCCSLWVCVGEGVVLAVGWVGGGVGCGCGVGGGVVACVWEGVVLAVGWARR